MEKTSSQDWTQDTTYTEWLPGVQLRSFSITCAACIEDCEGWWLSGCRSSVAEYWLYKSGVLGSISSGSSRFTVQYFTSDVSFGWLQDLY